MSGAFDEDAFDVGAFDEATSTPFVIAPPLPPPGRPSLAHTYQFFAGRPFTPALPVQPPRHFFPEPVRVPGRPALAHTYQFFATSPGVKVTVFSGFGPDGAATFVLALQPGTQVTNSWATDVITSYSGKEQRISLVDQPKRSFAGQAFLVDGSSRDARGALQRSAAGAATFLLALPHEQLSLTADSSAQTIFVATSLSDWIIQRQRVIVMGGDGSTIAGVIQSSTSTSIKLDVSPGAIGRKGGIVMPLLPVLLEPAQGFARYATRVDLWSIAAQSNVYGWCGVDSMGIGATVTTFNSGTPIPASTVTDDELLVWDRVNLIEGTASESMRSHAELVDLGGKPFSSAAADVPDWVRTVKLRSKSRADWQWWLAFTRLCRGRQRTWLLSTNQADLVFDSLTGDGIKVKSASTTGGGDYVSWFVSQAQQRLAIKKADGTTQYVQVTAVADNHDGTLSLTLDSVVLGTVTKISFLESVRFERDDLTATWTGAVWAVDEVVRTVQDLVAVETASRTLFDVDLSLDFTYNPPAVPPTDQFFDNVQLGKVTIIHWTSDRTLTFTGIRAAGGNVDGAVVCISVVNNNSHTISLAHESSSAAAQDRLWNNGLTTVGSSEIGVWYRYRQAAASGVGRWIRIM